MTILKHPAAQENTLDLAVEPIQNLGLASLDEFQEIVERPLFYATRRPPAPEVPEIAVQEEPQEEQEVALTLIGILAISGTQRVLIQNDDTRKVISLKPGDKIGGWLLQAIQSDKVTLRKGDDTKILPLIRNKRKPNLRTTLRKEQQKKRRRLKRQAGDDAENEDEAETNEGDTEQSEERAGQRDSEEQASEEREPKGESSTAEASSGTRKN